MAKYRRDNQGKWTDNSIYFSMQVFQRQSVTFTAGIPNFLKHVLFKLSERSTNGVLFCTLSSIKNHFSLI